MSDVFSLHQVAVRCGVDAQFIEQLVALGVIETAGEGEPSFAREVTVRIGRLMRLQRDLGVNLEGAAVILELLDRVEQLEHELRNLRLG